MKKLIFVLAIALMAVPAFAVDIALVREGTTNVIDVTYANNGTTAATRMRAVALKLTSPATTTMTLVSGSFKIGESVTGSLGYGIYPASIVIDTAGVVTSDGTPLADSGDPGAGTGNGSNYVVFEFGSLYLDPNAPGASGILCKFTFNPASVSNPTIAMIDEDTYRGGLVFEDGSLGVVNTSLVYTTAVAPGQATIVSPANGGKTALSTTLTWTAGSGATSHDVYFGTTNPPAFKVNQTGTTYATGAMANAKTYYWRIDEKNTAGTTTGVVWNFSTECYYGMADYAQWVEAGKPACWCQPRQCKGDADGLKQGDTKLGYYYVGPGDLNVLTNAWKIKLSPKGPGTTAAQNCADFDHLKQGDTKLGYYRVGPGDLNILTTYWKVKESPKGPGVSPTCLPGNIPSGN